ncbi:M13 family metallopeptidase [Mycoplasma sp. Pen4]|uniref:M13 family metallopeptidase n=1 Tax=Mycoplasma sp. Pen4 TaxID=640330 RepID=UPI0016549F5D|nr:M13 family metallopeptidase [Mycoplasma sp. Pen4]QNM93346.1 M13 family metallopeptidase [Mycoplasma sp. Pen4]
MNKPRLQDDFHDYINHDWLQTTKIPADRSGISAFGEIDLHTEKLLKTLTIEWASGKRELPKDKLIHEYVKLYQMVADAGTRKKLGWEPVRKFLDNILAIPSFKNISENYYKYEIEEGYTYLPLSFGCDEDFVNNKIKILWLDDQSLILPSKEKYQDQEQKEKLLKVWSDVVEELLVSYGKTQAEAQDLIKKAIKFDAKVVEYVLSSVEKADYVALYNLKDIEWYKDTVKQFNISEIANSLVKDDVKQIACTNVRYIEAVDKLYSDENFEGYKALCFIKNMLALTGYLSEDIRLTAFKYRQALYEIKEARKLDLYAYDVAERYYGMPLGLYYAHTYFGEEAKKDVEHMIYSMIDIYRERLQENTWLSPATKQKAITKLNKLGVMVGYPEEIRPYYEKLIVKTYEDGSNLFENVKNFGRIMTEYNFSLYLKETNPKFWGMSPAMVNAYFHPFANHIVFPAAILQKPFYSLNQSSSANYGAIGAVIAHEISHAFDNNGSQFDENGSLNNWWTDEDRARFEEKTKDVIALYDSRITPNGKVNGTLTVSENIADIGGFSCALEAASREKDFNPKDFFENWATCWRQIQSDSSAKIQLEQDVHAPAKERANVLLMNSDLFQETYEIQEEDKMFLPKDKRIKIW